jgi:sporulation protein YlmC with PRC-barrel domain
MSILSGLKEKGVSVGIKMFLQKYVEKYGEIKDVDIDLKKKEINCSLLLKGEEKTMSVELLGIRTQAVEEKYYLEFEGIKVSREWINVLVQEYIPKVVTDNRVEIPENVGKGLMMLNIVL